jgi:hypothetical protein
MNCQQWEVSSMRSDVKMEIYGTVSDAKLLDHIVKTALEACGSDEWKDFLAGVEDDDAVAMAKYISMIGGQGCPLVMEIEDTNYAFDHLRLLLRDAAEVGYRVQSSSEGSLGYDRTYTFRPGWLAERQIEIAGEDVPFIDYAALRAAMPKGINAVEEVVEKAEVAVLLPQRCGIVVPEAVYTAWKVAYDQEYGIGPSN